MGFWNDLFTGDVKKIGKDFANNLSHGRLMDGTGADVLINGVGNTLTAGLLSTAGDIIPDNIGNSLFADKIITDPSYNLNGKSLTQKSNNTQVLLVVVLLYFLYKRK